MGYGIFEMTCRVTEIRNIFVKTFLGYGILVPRPKQASYMVMNECRVMWVQYTHDLWFECSDIGDK